MTRVKECVLYRGFEHGDILDKMTALMDASEKSAVNASEMEEEFYECVNGLIEIAGSYGFTGNLWHDYLTLLLVNNENAYSKTCEIRGKVEGSVNQIVLHDFEIIKSLFDFDFGKLASYFEMDCMDAITDYQSMTGSGKIFNKRIKERINELKLKLETICWQQKL